MSYPPRNPYQQQQQQQQPPPPYGQSNYGQPSYRNNQQPPARYASPAPQGDVEMARLVSQPDPSTQPTTSASQDPYYIINECRRITDGIAQLNSHLTSLQTAQTRALNDPNNTSATADLENLNATITTEYKSLIARLKYIRSRPASTQPMNKGQVGLADRSLKEAFQRYKVLENNHQKRMREQTERQYRITRPDATDEEVRAAVDDPNAQIFAQAIMQSNRRGESRQVLGAVRERHEAIARIERQMQELAVLFQDMERVVIEQDPMIAHTEEKAEETYTHVTQANVHLDGANKSARAARKKKWICLGLSIAIILVIIIVLLIVLKILHVY